MLARGGVTEEIAMIHLIPLLAILPLLAFWLWMFSAMTKNELLTSEQKSN